MTLHEISDEIAQHEMAILNNNERLKEIRLAIAAEEVAATVFVLGVRDERDKPLYTNDVARSAAKAERLRGHAEYQAAVRQERDLAYGISVETIERERLYRTYRISLIDTEALVLGRRDAR